MAAVGNTVTRREVLGFRVRAQQLDRDAGALDDTALLDIGAQDSGRSVSRPSCSRHSAAHG
jgi:hypothetical protein